MFSTTVDQFDYSGSNSGHNMQILKSEIDARRPGFVYQEPHLHLWTREEYYRIADAGLFWDKRVELIEGQVVEMSPMKSSHATGIGLVVEVLRQGVKTDVHVREQKPLVLSDFSELEPDVAVVSGTLRDYAQAHPTTALLVIEVVPESTLHFNCQMKGSLYARAKLEDFWILNLVQRCLEVYRFPVEDPEAFYEFRYAEKRIHQVGEQVSPLLLPELQISVAELLP